MSRLICSGDSLPYDPDLVKLAQDLRKRMTSHEMKLWHGFLRYRKPPFYRQRPIDCYIVDFYQPASKLVIELDGKHHFTEEGIESDKDRDMNLEGYGLNIIRFTNNEIDHNFDQVCKKILSHCKSPFDKGGNEGGII
jgi:very-short-patch-repair endonuclease